MTLSQKCWKGNGILYSPLENRALHSYEECAWRAKTLKKRQSWNHLSDETVGSWEWWERTDRRSLLLQSIAPIPAWPGFSFLTIPVVTWIMGSGSSGLLWFFFWRQDLLARSCMVTWRFGKQDLTEVSQHEGPYWFFKPKFVEVLCSERTVHKEH